MATNTSTTGVFLNETYQKAVEADVAKQSRQLGVMEDQKKKLQKEIAAYEDMKERIRGLSDISKEIYSFKSPFRNLIGIGDAVGQYYTIAADRKATRNTTHSLDILGLAESLKFSSKPIGMNEQISTGNITLSINGRDISLDFAGGNLFAFKQAFDKVFKDEIKTTIVQKTKNNQVMIFEISKTGSMNVVDKVVDETDALAPLNLFTTRNYQYLKYIFGKNSMNELKDLSENIETNYFVKNDMLIMQAENKISVPLKREANGNENLTLSLTIRIAENGATDFDAPLLPPVVNLGTAIKIPNQGVQFNKIDGVKFADIEIYGESIFPFTEDRPFENAKKFNEALEREKQNNENKTAEAPLPVNGIDATIIGIKYVNDKGQTLEKYFALPTISADWQRLSIPIGTEFNEDDILTDFILINKNKAYTIFCKDILIEDKNKTEYVPNYLLSEAKDSRIIIDGVEVRSDSNEIKNALEGITVVAKKTTEGETTFVVDADKNKIAAVIVDFINAYNYLIEFANTTLKTPLSQDIKENIDDMSRTELIDLAIQNNLNLDPEISDTALRRTVSYIGVFNGNVTVTSMVQKLQQTMFDIYPTKYKEEFALLSQIGINRGKAGEEWQTIRSGLFRIDEDIFIAKIETVSDGVEELFASASDPESLIPNNGVAFKIAEIADSYSRTRGIIDTTVISSKDKLEYLNTRITKEKDKIALYRKAQESKYMKMENDLKNAEREMKRLDQTQRQSN